MKILNKTIFFPIFLFTAALILKPAQAQDDLPFDTDRGIWLVDSDADSYPDLTERYAGTDPFNPDETPRFAEEEDIDDSFLDSSDIDPSTRLDSTSDQVGFPATSCRSGYRQAGRRLCINPQKRIARPYQSAAYICRITRGRVCGYEDLSYLYFWTNLDRFYNPHGAWLGDFTADDRVLCGNKHVTFDNDPDIWNFENTCRKSDRREYWCCHDRL